MNNIENLKDAAALYEQLEAVRNSRKKLDVIRSNDGTSAEYFSLTEVGTSIDLELTNCLVMDDILSAIDELLIKKTEEIFNKAKQL
ncbi:MAG: hypothetical protein KAT04_15440 [Methylococcales bacterium]|nr:hypothetical protein [Methylococcales bacterium]